MFKHVDKHANEIIFVRCTDRSCCTEWRSMEVKEFLKVRMDPTEDLDMQQNLNEEPSNHVMNSHKLNSVLSVENIAARLGPPLQNNYYNYRSVIPGK